MSGSKPGRVLRKRERVSVPVGEGREPASGVLPEPGVNPERSPGRGMKAREPEHVRQEATRSEPSLRESPPLRVDPVSEAPVVSVRARRWPRVTDDPVGTAHPVSRCGWCASALVIGEVGRGAFDKGGLRCWLCPACYPRQLAVAVMQVGRGGQHRVFHVPLPSQVPIYEASREGGYLLWGGQAGPGKSAGTRWVCYWRSLLVPGHESLLLRENWDQLRDNHTLKMAWEVPLLGGRWKDGDRLAVFGSGSDESLIHCGHMADLAALQRYIGIEYGLIAADEGSLYPVDGQGVPVLAELSTRVRKTYRDRTGAHVPGLFLVPTNPGGPSAPWLTDMFIDHTPDYELYPALRPVYVDDDEISGYALQDASKTPVLPPGYTAAGEQVSGYRAEDWRYVPAKLDDNPYLPGDYRAKTLAVLSGTRFAQLAEGDWRAVAGAFFRAFSTSVHVAESVIA